MIASKLNENSFKELLTFYKNQIDSDILQFASASQSEALDNFGAYPSEAVKAFYSILSRGGKRIRGALVMHAYQMYGGTDNVVAVQAARAIELLHAYILIIDDIQDRSETRRGGPTAHILLRNYHQEHNLSSDSMHFGESIALNGSLYGVHTALNVLANLHVDPELRLRAIQNVNRHFIATAHGQSLDIFNEVVARVSEAEVDNVLIWKTAYYTFMNPLQLGAILAGATEEDLRSLEAYSLQAGRVFQITDDIIGVFGAKDTSGKDPLDDIREGKRTILVVKALELAVSSDAKFLQSMLGNAELSNDQFLRCKSIIESCGALEYARQKAEESARLAKERIAVLKPRVDEDQLVFLEQLTDFMVQRKA